MIYSFSGKIGSGKDTAASIFDILYANPHLNNEGVKVFLKKGIKGSFQNKKWADKLKDFVSSITGVSRELMEDRVVKERELGESWWYYKIPQPNGTFELVDYLNNDKDEAWLAIANPRFLVKPSIRTLLQQAGTECGRNILHPNIWVNALMSEYENLEHIAKIKIIRKGFNTLGLNRRIKWLITDTRFPNEIKAVKDREGITIRVNRFMCSKCGNTDNFEGGNDLCNECGHFKSNDKEHESETALDSYNDWDYIIDNNGSIDELINSVRRILQAEFPYAQFNNNLKE